MAGINIRSSFLVALLAYLAIHLAQRVRVLSLAYFNAPGRMPVYANFTSSEIRFEDQIRDCEDTVLVESRGLALLACDTGRETWNPVMNFVVDDAERHHSAEFWAYNYADSSLSDSQSLQRIKFVGLSSELRTIGFEIHEPSSTLFVTNVGPQGPRVEQFHLDLDTLTATHKRTLIHPLIRSPNSIVALSDSDFLLTNQHHFTAREYGPLLWAFETYVAPPISSIVHVRILDDGTLDAAVVARQPYSNGITLLNDGTVAVAATNERLVYLYEMSPGKSQMRPHPRLEKKSSIWLPFLPDNLSVSKRDGALLIAGHPHLPSLNKFARSRHICHRPEVLAKGGKEAEKMCNTTTAASWASEWTPEGGLKHIYAGWEYPTSASAVRDKDKGVGIVSGLYGKGIFIWRD
ncbi:hypothetical protein F4859DRAFT_477492 [Xylaria cf. heliscus]|nr:hypothetical protein F4859DRAFT_477492 [Xylaria cf. heliscus]